MFPSTIAAAKTEVMCVMDYSYSKLDKKEALTIKLMYSRVHGKSRRIILKMVMSSCEWKTL